MLNPPATSKALLSPLPLIKAPFKRIAMDFVGSLGQTPWGQCFVLRLCNAITGIDASALQLPTCCGGTLLCHLLNWDSKRNSDYRALHAPFANCGNYQGFLPVHTMCGRNEGFNQTLRNMICKFVPQCLKWDKGFKPLLFVVEQVLQVSTRFFSFELLHGCKPHSVLDVIRKNWEEESFTSTNEIQDILDLRAKLHTLHHLTKETLQETKCLYCYPPQALNYLQNSKEPLRSSQRRLIWGPANNWVGAP